MRRAVLSLGWAAVAALALLPGARSGDANESRSFAVRLAGPFASLAASVQWLRVDQDLDAGRFARGYARAETALALDPRSSAGWTFLADHFIYNRARPELEPSPAARRAFLEAGLGVLARGERVVRDPGRLAFDAGLALVHTTAYEDVHERPGGASGAFEEAARHFERAAGHGHPLGAEAAELASQRAHGADEPGHDDHDH